MFTRRTLMASMAALAAACGPFRSSPDLPSGPDAAALTWYTFSFSGLFDRSEVLEGPQERLPKIIAALEEDVDNPNGPARGRLHPVAAPDRPRMTTRTLLPRTMMSLRSGSAASIRISYLSVPVWRSP